MNDYGMKRRLHIMIDWVTILILIAALVLIHVNQDALWAMLVGVFSLVLWTHILRTHIGSADETTDQGRRAKP